MEASKLLALYLGGIGLVLAAFAYSFANGAVAPKLSLVGLSQARVGLYHRAQAIKQISTAAFVDSNVTLQGSTPERVNRSIRSGKLTFHQRTNCIQNTYARDCNLPYIEVSLGLALSLSLFALSSALVFWLSQPNTWLLARFVLTVMLICLAGLGWLERTRPPAGSLLARLHTLEVGIYKNLESLPAKTDASDPEWLEKLSDRARQSRSYCRLPNFTLNCGITVLETPLSLAFFLGLGSLIGGVFAILLRLTGLTISSPKTTPLPIYRDEI